MSDFTPDGVMMVTDMDDFDLLHRFSTEGSQDAFRQLVERHLGMVYASARRQVRSPDLAQEVAQSAFLELAREAGRLQRGRPLGPWLYVVTHRKALDVLRRESRQRQRDQIAAEVAAINQASADWVRVEPLLDQAINELAEPDRQAVILRYFEDRSLREVGGALGVSDDAAQKRISRALERLRELLGRRGIAATTAGLATEITAHAAVSVPTDLAASISSVAAAAAAGTAVTSTSAIAMTLIQKSLIATLLFGAAAGVVLYQHQTIADQERAIGTLQSQIDDLRHQAHQSARSARAVAATEAPDAGPVTAAGSLGAKLGELQKHIEDLKTRFAADPKQAIPEMALLSDLEWISIASHHPRLETDDDYRKAMADIRTVAETDFSRPLQKAMRSYLQTSQNQFPNDISQLSPYFDPPVDPAMLQRYQLLNPGATDDPGAQGPDFFAGLKLSAVPDPAYDMAMEPALQGVRTYNLADYAAELAASAYRAANNGQPPQDASQLAPYFSDPDLAKKFLAKPHSNQQLMQLRAGSR